MLCIFFRESSQTTKEPIPPSSSQPEASLLLSQARVENSLNELNDILREEQQNLENGDMDVEAGGVNTHCHLLDVKTMEEYRRSM